mmetsp:Transcript_15346/g.39323  ORF Transcript_15346/g.39323 Transcript_15346/m.39323 type:complete len:110 (+) Transcript_15346:89-418(+)
MSESERELVAATHGRVVAKLLNVAWCDERHAHRMIYQRLQCEVDETEDAEQRRLESGMAPEVSEAAAGQLAVPLSVGTDSSAFEIVQVGVVTTMPEVEARGLKSCRRWM